MDKSAPRTAQSSREIVEETPSPDFSNEAKETHSTKPHFGLDLDDTGDYRAGQDCGDLYGCDYSFDDLARQVHRALEDMDVALNLNLRWDREHYVQASDDSCDSYSSVVEFPLDNYLFSLDRQTTSKQIIPKDHSLGLKRYGDKYHFSYRIPEHIFEAHPMFPREQLTRVELHASQGLPPPRKKQYGGHDLILPTKLDTMVLERVHDIEEMLGDVRRLLLTQTSITKFLDNIVNQKEAAQYVTQDDQHSGEDNSSICDSAFSFLSHGIVRSYFITSAACAASTRMRRILTLGSMMELQKDKLINDVAKAATRKKYPVSGPDLFYGRQCRKIFLDILKKILASAKSRKLSQPAQEELKMFIKEEQNAMESIAAEASSSESEDSEDADMETELVQSFGMLDQTYPKSTKKSKAHKNMPNRIRNILIRRYKHAQKNIDKIQEKIEDGGKEAARKYKGVLEMQQNKVHEMEQECEEYGITLQHLLNSSTHSQLSRDDSTNLPVQARSLKRPHQGGSSYFFSGATEASSKAVPDDDVWYGKRTFRGTSQYGPRHIGPGGPRAPGPSGYGSNWRGHSSVYRNQHIAGFYEGCDQPPVPLMPEQSIRGHHRHASHRYDYSSHRQRGNWRDVNRDVTYHQQWDHPANSGARNLDSRSYNQW